MRLIYLDLFVIFAVSGCAISKVSEPARKSGFVEYKAEGARSELFPFEYVWLKRPTGERRVKAGNIAIKVISSDYLAEDAWKDSLSAAISTEEDYQSYTKEVAERFKNKLTSEINSRAKELSSELKIVEDPARSDFVMEIAFTEVVFGNPGTYAVALAAPVPGVSYAVDSAKSPFASIEGRVTSRRTGEVVALFADKKFPRIKPLDVNKLTIRS